MADTEKTDKAKQFLFDRARAYQTSLPKDGPSAVVVLADLAAFCRAHESTFHPEARVAAQLDGRREVYLRILDHLTLSPEALWLKYGVGVITKGSAT